MLNSEARSNESGNSGRGGDSKKHDATNSKSSLPENNAPQFPCPVCFKFFSSGQALGGHQNAHRYERKQYRAVFPAAEVATIRSSSLLWNNVATPSLTTTPFTPPPNHEFASSAAQFDSVGLGRSEPIQYVLYPATEDLGRYHHNPHYYYHNQPNWVANSEVGPRFYGGGDDIMMAQGANHDHNDDQEDGMLDLELRL